MKDNKEMVRLEELMDDLEIHEKEVNLDDFCDEFDKIEMEKKDN